MVRIVKKITKGDVVKTILKTVKFSGLLSIALITPAVLKALINLGIVDLKNKGVISNARNRLVKDGFLKRDSKGFLYLTEKGEQKLQDYELSDYELILPKIWDGKWRVLIFDIPERRRKIRDKVRNTLRSIGFIRMQDSVWIFPYDCSELVTLFKADFKIGKDLLYMLVDQVENDKYLKEYFDLL